MPVEPQKPYISSKEAAKKYDLTNDHIGLLCRRGKVAGLLWGRVWYVSEPSLDEYVKKSLVLKEARKKALSKQWHAAWTAVFLAFAVFSLNTTNASADYVTPSPRLKPAPIPAAVTVASVVASVGEFKKSVPLPQVPKLVAQPAKQEDTRFFADMGEGLMMVGERVATIFGAQHGASQKEVRVMYASDFVPASDAPSKLVAPRPAKSLPEQLMAAAQTASAALATAPPMIPTLSPLKENSFFTGENLVAGTAAANEILDEINGALFAAYANSIEDLGRIALFDAAQASFTFDQIFGEFGRQYVHDLSAANELQIHAYLKAGEAVNNGYNSLADAIDRIPSLDSSISVASAGYSIDGSDLRAAADETVAAWWSGAVDYLSNIFVAVVADSHSLASSAPAKPTASAPAAAHAVAQADTTGQKSGSTLLPSSYSPEPTALTYPAPAQTPLTSLTPQPGFASATAPASVLQVVPSIYASNFVTQSQLNSQFDAWMLAVKALVAGNTGYVNNPEVAALGGGGGGTVNNYYSYSQRIDKLDGVTITNSSINGVSDFTSLGGGSSLWATNGSNISFTGGNVGIGTTTPAYPLSVVGPAYSSSGFITDGADIGGTGYFSFMNPDGGAIYGGLAPGGYPGGFIYFPGIDRPEVGFGDTPGGAVIGLNPTNGVNAFVVSNFTDPSTYTPLIAVPSTGGLAVGSSYSGVGLPPTDGLIVEGKAGIGNPNPASKLDVFGSAQLDTDTGTEDVVHIGRQQTDFLKNVSVLAIAVGSYEASGNSKTRVDFKLADDSNLSNNWGGNPDITILTMLANGRVGIGTTSPYARFSVAGDIVGTNIIATGTVKLPALASQNCLGTDSSGKVQAGTCSGGGSLYASTTIGDGTQAGGLTITGGATTTGGVVNIIGNNNANSGANIFTVVNKGSINGMVAGTQFFNDIGNNVGLRFRDSSGAAIRTNLGVTTNTYFANLTNVNVGVGTSTPWAKFSIANFTGDTPGQALFAVASSTANSTTTLFTITNGGNVGIGTTTPAALMHVWGGSASTDNILGVFQVPFSNANTAASIVLADQGTGNYVTFTNGVTKLTGTRQSDGSNNFDVFLAPGSSQSIVSRLTVVGASGNLGLGTTSPFAKLSINNSTNDPAGQALFAVASSTANSTTTLFSISNTGAVQIGTNGQGIDIGTNTGGSTAYVSFQSANASNRSFVGFSPNTFGADSGATVLQAGSARGIALAVNNGTFGNNSAVALYINPSGNVGIGSTSPYAKLSVAGDIVGTNITATGTLSALSANIGGQTQLSGIFQAEGGDAYFGDENNTVRGIYLRRGGSTIGGLNTSSTRLNIFTGSGVNGGGTGGANTLTMAGNLFAIGSTSPSILNKFAISLQSTLDTSINAFIIASSTANSTTTLFTILNSGNVGIGTTSPQAQLAIDGNGAGSGIVIGSAGFGYNQIFNNQGALQFKTAGNSLIFQSNTIEWGRFLGNNGNFGLGTTSPYARLSVVGEAVATNFTATSTTATSTIAGGLNVGSGALNYDFSSGVTSINNAAFGSFTFDTDAGIVSWADLPISSNAAAGTIESYTANVGGSPVLTVYGEADGSGNATNLRVGIGSTSPSAIGGTAAYLTLDKSATAQYSLLSFATSTGSVVQFAFANGNGVVGTISTNGSATAYNTSSDRRIKENIASTTMGLSQLMELPVRDFSFLADSSHATTTGFIAQELYKIFPYAVTTNGDDGTGSLATGTLPWSVDYGRITPLIVKAVQDIADITSTFKTNLISWLADAGNGITKLFAKEVHTDTLCVGNTCVTQEQFLAMVQASAQHANAPAPSAPVVDTPEATSTATSTPEVPAPAGQSASSTPDVIIDASSTPPAPLAPQATSTPEATLNESAILDSIGATSSAQ